MDYIRFYGSQAVSQQNIQPDELNNMTDTSSSHVVAFQPTKLEAEALNKWKLDSLHLVLSYHRKIAKKAQQLKKLSETSLKGHLTMDLACLNLRPFQWPKSMSAEYTRELDSAHANSINKALIAIQMDRLEKLERDLESFKTEFSDQELINTCRGKLQVACPNVFKSDDLVHRLTEGLTRDILQSEISHQQKPQTIPAPPLTSNVMDSRHDFQDVIKEMRAEIKALQAEIGRNKTSKSLSSPRKSTPTRGNPQKSNVPKKSDNDDHTYQTVRYGRSKSPKNVDRVGKGPQKNSTRTSTGSVSQESREASPLSRTTRQSRSLQKNRNSRSPSHSNDPTIDRRSQEGGKRGKGKGKHLY